MIPIGFLCVLLSISLVFTAIMWVRTAHDLNLIQQVNSDLETAIDNEYVASQTFRAERDEHKRLAADLLKQLTDAKEKFKTTLAASEADRRDARMQAQDLRAERDFHHSASEALSAENESLRKQLQQEAEKTNSLLGLNDVLQAKLTDYKVRIDRLKNDTDYEFPPG